MSKPIVCIVGRPNVGKSVLFNKLAGFRKAITNDENGVTRDLNYATVTHEGKEFTLIDTGGFDTSKDEILKKVVEQTMLAVEEADLIVLLLDGKAGLMQTDREVANILRKSSKEIIFAVNKIDDPSQADLINDFYTLGADTLHPLTAEHGEGIYELTNEIVSRLDFSEQQDIDESVIKTAILGRPNAGKSSILNSLIKSKRSIVSDVAGTTRASVDTLYTYNDTDYLFIDTAGIRQKSRISTRLEQYCVMDAIGRMENADTCLLVVDAEQGISTQDERIAGLIEDRGKDCIIVVNKWDLIEKDTMSTKNTSDEIDDKMPFISYAPKIFVSALTGQRVEKIFDLIKDIHDKGKEQYKTSLLNDTLTKISRRHNHPVYKHKNIKFYYITQTGNSPLRFAIFCNYPDGIIDSYKRYMRNSFREMLNLEHVPFRLAFRKRS